MQLLGKFAAAEPLLVNSHQLLVAARAAGHRDILRAESYLAEFYARWNTAEPDAARAAKTAKWQAKGNQPR